MFFRFNFLVTLQQRKVALCPASYQWHLNTDIFLLSRPGLKKSKQSNRTSCSAIDRRGWFIGLASHADIGRCGRSEVKKNEVDTTPFSSSSPRKGSFLHTDPYLYLKNEAKKRKTGENRGKRALPPFCKNHPRAKLLSLEGCRRCRHLKILANFANITGINKPLLQILLTLPDLTYL